MVSVHRQINKIKQTGTAEKKTGSSRLRTATAEENKQYVEEMISSQEECSGANISRRQIAAHLQVSRQSVQRMTKVLGYKAFKRIRVSRRDANVRTKLYVGTCMINIQIRMRKNLCSLMRKTSSHSIKHSIP